MAPATTKQTIALCKTYFNHTLQFAEYQLHLIFDYSSRLHKPLEGHALYRICLLDIGGIRLQVSVILALYLRHTYRTCSCLRSWILIRLSHKKRTPNLKCVLLIWGPFSYILDISYFSTASRLLEYGCQPSEGEASPRPLPHG